MSTKWTEETILQEIAKYKTLKDFANDAHGAYLASKRLGIFADVTKGLLRSKPQEWTEQNILLEALKYSKKVHFSMQSKGAYKAAKRLGIFAQCVQHMDKTSIFWTNKKLELEALKYKTRQEFFIGNKGAYQAAWLRKQLDVICSHMVEGISGFKPSKPAIFYLYSFNTFIGFGITANLKIRHKAHKVEFKKKGLTAELLASLSFDIGSDARDLERLIIALFPIVNSGVEGFKREAVESKYMEELLIFCHNYREHVYNKKLF